MSRRPKEMRFYNVLMAMQSFAGKSLKALDYSKQLTDPEIDGMESGMRRIAASLQTEVGEFQPEFERLAEQISKWVPPQPMMVPTLHLNGTSRRELISQLLGAATAVSKAQDALGQAAPHGRDYYVQDDSATAGDAIRQATLQHISRLQRLESVRKELENIAIAMDEQEGAVTRPLAARDVLVGDSWAFQDHRTLAEVYRNGRLVQPIRRQAHRSPKARKFIGYRQRQRRAA